MDVTFAAGGTIAFVANSDSLAVRKDGANKTVALR